MTLSTHNFLFTDIGNVVRRFQEQKIEMCMSSSVESAETVQCSVLEFQMPATSPILSEISATPNADDPDTPGKSHRIGTPFTLRYDKLVIAVGAYSQSLSVNFHHQSLF
jgi:hypothetical protein